MDAEKPAERSIPLWEDGEYDSAGADNFRPWLDPYALQTGTPQRAVLICPGGGYGGRAAHEGVVIAERFNREGLAAFVVHYSVAPRRHPQPIRDVSRAMRMIRRNAAAWGVDPSRIAVLGFSAGGHLAASLAVHHEREFCADGGAYAGVSNRPDAAILCYPVITSGRFAHNGSFGNLLGPLAADAAMRRLMSLERHVSKRTPPTFLWHTWEDGGVPVENAMLFASALRRRKVPFELHVYPKGNHGLGLAGNDPHVATWFPLCCQWLRAL